MRVAVVQHDICWEDAAATRAHLGPLVAGAASGGARLVVLSEMFATGFSMRTAQIAEPAGGPTERWLTEQAARHQLWVTGSIAQFDGGDGRAVNVAVLAAPDGTVYRYVKIHPFSYAREHEFYRPGDAFVTVVVDGVRVTLFVCYDLRFADEFWAVAADTDCYVVVANWPAKRREHWRALLQARAIENQAYVIGANRVGRADGLDYCGDSVVLDPMGRQLVEARDAETVLSAEIDPAQVRGTREHFPFLADRRADRR